jgi:hypothetical protein
MLRQAVVETIRTGSARHIYRSLFLKGSKMSLHHKFRANSWNTIVQMKLVFKYYLQISYLQFLS